MIYIFRFDYYYFVFFLYEKIDIRKVDLRQIRAYVHIYYTYRKNYKIIVIK